MSSMLTTWQTDVFIQIASWYKAESSTGSTIAPGDLLQPECWWQNRHYLLAIIPLTSRLFQSW